MAYGLSIFDTNASNVFTVTDQTWLQIDYFFVGAGQSVTKNFTGLPSGITLQTAVIFVNTPPINSQFRNPTISISGTTVTVTGIQTSASSSVSGTYTVQSGGAYILVLAK